MKQFFFLFLPLFLSCSSNNLGNNDNLGVSQHEFEDILKKIHLLEAKFELNRVNNKEKAVSELTHEYNNIYSEYNINQEDLENILTHYFSKKPELLEDLYLELLEDLKDEKSTL